MEAFDRDGEPRLCLFHGLTVDFVGRLCHGNGPSSTIATWLSSITTVQPRLLAGAHRAHTRGAAHRCICIILDFKCILRRYKSGGTMCVEHLFILRFDWHLCVSEERKHMQVTWGRKWNCLASLSPRSTHLSLEERHGTTSWPFIYLNAVYWPRCSVCKLCASFRTLRSTNVDPRKPSCWTWVGDAPMISSASQTDLIFKSTLWKVCAGFLAFCSLMT